MRLTLWISWLCTSLCAQNPLPQLLDRLRSASDADRPSHLEALEQLGPAAAAAVPVLWQLLLEEGKRASSDATFATISELLPYREADVLSDPQVVQLELLQSQMGQGGWPSLDPASCLKQERFRLRLAFPHTADVATLIDFLDSRNALRVEAAVDVLRTKGAAAKTALPALQALLERPEPRYLLTERTLPMHRKAALAVAAIAPNSPTARFADSVLARDGVKPVEVAIPARAQARIDELLRELGVASTREQAAANLLALGSLSARSLAGRLTVKEDPEFLAAAIAVLDGLGPRAAEAVPAMLTALTALPARHTVALIDALAQCAPWCRDVVPPLWYSSSVGSLELFGHRIQGDIDVDFLNAMGVAGGRFYAAMSVDPGSSLATLEGLLASPLVSTRECTLAVLRERGSSARSLLPALAGMLTAEHPRRFLNEWTDAQTAGSKQVDCTAEVQRRAAETSLRIAAPDDPHVAAARAVLARTSGK